MTVQSAFRKDFERHKVEAGSAWDWKEDPKWGWEIVFVEALNEPVQLKVKTGIVYTNNIKL